jgi:hypothetical protein
LRLSNRIEGPGVLIVRHRGWFRCIVMTPSDPDQFIGEVNAIRLREMP